MKTVVLVDGCRTPFLKEGTVPGVTATEMGCAPIRALFTRHPQSSRLVDYVIGANAGNQLLPPDGSNIARILAVTAGVRKEVPAHTVNMNCVSSLEAVAQATEKIALGKAECVLVAAVEVMSDYTLVLGRKQHARYEKMRAASGSKSAWWKRFSGILAAQAEIWAHGHKPFLAKNFGDAPLWMLQTGLTDPLCGLGMSGTAENVARTYEIGRAEQDFFARQSHQRAQTARDAGRFAKEIVPFRGHEHDNGIRDNQGMKKLAKLRPLEKDGTVTAGNSSQVTDGAVALLLAELEFAHRNGLPVLARLAPNFFAAAGAEPAHMGIGPIYAIEKLLRRTGLSLADYDLVETNEAFAAVVLAQSTIFASPMLSRAHGVDGKGKNEKCGGFDWERTNVNGGAIALGHPIAATGARLILSAALELSHRKGVRALVTACVGGGQGYAATILRI